MKIAFVSDNFYPELSGITESLLLVTKTLKKRGHEFFFIVPFYSKKNYALLKKTDTVRAQELSSDHVTRLPSLPLPYSPTKQSRIVIPLGIGVFKLWKLHPDIIHTHTPFGAGIEALIASRLFNIPMVGTNHTVTQEFIFHGPFPKKFIDYLVLRYVSWYFNQCTFVSSPSQSLLNEMKEYKLITQSKQISNPLDTELFSPTTRDEKKKAKEKYNLTEHTVLYTGRLAPEKHVDDIVRAIHKIVGQFPNICFAIAGHGKDEEVLKKLAHKLGIEKNVRFLGFVPSTDIPLLYKGSEIFVIMSTSDTQSLSLVQGMATGLPAIVADAGALPEYLDSKSGFVVAPGDYTALSEHIIELFKNPALYKTLGEGGLEKVKQFNKNHIADIWESIYERATH
jgi:glycosyltransferase involved in cell wall biosynthesis